MKVLAVGAHPDDIEFQCAGTLAKYRKFGHKVAIAIATNGEVGSAVHNKEETAIMRRKEAEASADVIGAEFHWMGYPDEFLFNNHETRLKFIDMVRSAKPDIIICPDPENDYHPDHRISGQIIWDIHVMLTVPNIITDNPPCEKIPNIYYMDTTGGVNFIPEKYVDITSVIKTKKMMLACHKSQDSWMFNQYGVTLIEMMEKFSGMRGFQCGCSFAEGFKIPPIWPRTIGPDDLL